MSSVLILIGKSLFLNILINYSEEIGVISRTTVIIKYLGGLNPFHYIINTISVIIII